MLLPTRPTEDNPAQKTVGKPPLPTLRAFDGDPVRTRFARMGGKATPPGGRRDPPPHCWRMRGLLDSPGRESCLRAGAGTAAHSARVDSCVRSGARAARTSADVVAPMWCGAGATSALVLAVNVWSEPGSEFGSWVSRGALLVVPRGRWLGWSGVGVCHADQCCCEGDGGVRGEDGDRRVGGEQSGGAVHGDGRLGGGPG
jgi:hypothetical protein